jgi:putative membrane protein insertion efficiency factor
MNKIALFLIKFYQKYLSIISFGSCRYHPTCSSYAVIQFENNSFFKALWFTTIRIFKCNPLFDGGFDYPKAKCNPNNKQINLEFKKIKVKYWRIPVHKDSCLIIRHNSKWDK